MRPSKDLYFARMAELVSTRATCMRRAVGCVLVNLRGHVLSTGYNGRPSGAPHCNHIGDIFDSTKIPYACESAFAKSGDALNGCDAIHAEQNALLQCRDVYAIHTCYTTTSPCITCVKLLLNTSCTRIVYHTPYEAQFDTVTRLWYPNEMIWSGELS